MKYIYLQAEVDTIIERMTARGREAEAKVPSDYLELLNQKHNEWVGRMFPDDCSVINAHDDADTVWSHMCEAMKPWFDEAGEDFKAQRETDRSTAEWQKNLTIMIRSTELAAAALHQQSPEDREERASKRPKVEPVPCA